MSPAPSDVPDDQAPLHVGGASEGDVVGEPAAVVHEREPDGTTDREPLLATEPAIEAELPGLEGERASETDLGTAGEDETAPDGTGPHESGDAPLETVAAAIDAEPDPRPLFSELGLSEPIVRAVEEKGYLHPTPIQEQAIPYVLMGRDVLGVAQTGTGKTASFTLPLLEILSDSRARARMPRSLILEPTRELALQVAENFIDYGRHLKLNHALLIGGESMSDQKEALMRGVDVLIATPGRLIDLFERGGLLLNDTRILVIDEADRMLDMGFIPDVERIVAMVSPMRQTLFFSATMAPEIRRLADAFLRNPKEITVARTAAVTDLIETGLLLVDEIDKRRALRALLRRGDVGNALIFCNRKRDVDVLTRSLLKHGFSAGALHGDLAQSVRFATLERFKAGELHLLVCSDVAARGIDIGGLSHVFNFDVPIHSEDYIHRIGRTGRAGRTGQALSLAGPEDRLLVDAIERLIGAPIPRISVDGVNTAEWAEVEGGRRRGGRGGGHRGGRGDRGGERGDRGGERGGERGERGGGGQPARAAPRQDETSRPPANARRERDDRRPRRDEVAEKRPPERERAEPVQAVAAPAPARERERPRREERGWRGGREDLGPNVLGFGDAMPDFMALPRRVRRVTEDLEAAPLADHPTTDMPASVVHIPLTVAPPPPLSEASGAAPDQSAGPVAAPLGDMLDEPSRPLSDVDLPAPHATGTIDGSDPDAGPSSLFPAPDAAPPAADTGTARREAEDSELPTAEAAAPETATPEPAAPHAAEPAGTPSPVAAVVHAPESAETRAAEPQTAHGAEPPDASETDQDRAPHETGGTAPQPASDHEHDARTPPAPDTADT